MRLAGVVLESAELGPRLRVKVLGHVAVTPAEGAKEERPAFRDDFAADFHGVLLTSNAPAQVHAHEMNSPPSYPGPHRDLSKGR